MTIRILWYYGFGMAFLTIGFAEVWTRFAAHNLINQTRHEILFFADNLARTQPAWLGIDPTEPSASEIVPLDEHQWLHKAAELLAHHPLQPQVQLGPLDPEAENNSTASLLPSWWGWPLPYWSMPPLQFTWKIPHTSPVRTLRFSISADHVLRLAFQLRWTIYAGGLLLLVVGECYLGYRLFWLYRRLEQASTFVRAMLEGQVGITAPAPGPGRLGLFLQELQQYQTEWQDRFFTLQRARDDLQRMLESIPEGVLAIDHEQNILFANASLFRLLGSTRRNGAPSKYWEVFRHPGFHEAIEKTLQQDLPFTTEFEIFDPPRSLAYQGQQLTLGTSQGAILIVRDITEIRRLERLRHEFFANVSHELKTPLTSIKAFTETLLEELDDFDRLHFQNYLSKIEYQADRLERLVMDMLTLARAETDRLSYEMQWVDCAEVIRHLLQQFEEQAGQKSIQLQFEPEDTQPLMVWADSEGLTTILKNLVDNAIKYTPNGGRVTVQTRKLSNQKREIQVIDTGVGIPKQDQARIFERFYRVDKARSRLMGGTGLGLSIVKHLVHNFGGTVTVSSKIDQGSCFTIQLRAA